MPVDKACVDNAMGATRPADAGPRACPLSSNSRLPKSKPKTEPTAPPGNAATPRTLATEAGTTPTSQWGATEPCAY